MPKNKSTALELLGLSLLPVAIILPLIIWRLNLSIVEATYDGSAPGTLATAPFELFAFLMTILLGITAWSYIQKQPRKTVKTLIPILLPLLTCLSLLFIQGEAFHAKSSDYICYEDAARAILTGLNPYAGSPPCYIYPPLLAQVLASLHQLAAYHPLFAFTNEDKAWTAVSYFYQCGQFLQIILAYFLTLRLAQTLKIKALPASFLVSALFLFNYPLTRTITFDQINLWILNSFLLGILLLQRHPLLGGLAVSLGVHLKLYPLVLLLPWGFTRRWRALIGVAAGIIAIAVLQTGFAHDWTLWQQFFAYFKNPEKPSNYRNNGLWSLIFNLAKIFHRFIDASLLSSLVNVIVAGLSLLLLAWFVLRLVQREQIYAKLTKEFAGKRDSWADIFRLYGHGIDAIALSLLISPSVWEHHYVIAIPIALWTIATRQFNNPKLVYIATFLIFCVPVFEIFPLSYHRLAGLLMLIYEAAPSTVLNYFMYQRGKNRETILSPGL